MNKEQLREARLRRLDGASAAIVSSSQLCAHSEETITLAGYQRALNLMHGASGGVTQSDMERWYNEAFTISESDPNFTFGLKQQGGGPCGILAAIQAEIINSVLFEDDAYLNMHSNSSSGRRNSNTSSLPQLNSAEVKHHLITAIFFILQRASLAPTNTIRIVELTSSQSAHFSETTSHSDLRLHSFTSRESAMAHISLHLDAFTSRSGVMLFLLSLIYTHTIAAIEQEMDQQDNTLIGHFGYCNQELINLLLTGRATSNVMDGDIPLGDSGLMIRGVSGRSKIGYLTHLEALNLCMVGNYYKVPLHPVWVIGSSSHFTVLFTMNRSINEESASEKMQSSVLRAFKAIDTEECGFISTDKLQELCEALEMPIALDATALARLRGHLKLDGDIILWSSFWECVSRMLVGVPLDSIIDETLREGISEDGAMNVDNSAAVDALCAMSGVVQSDIGRNRSDSEVARELQEQFNRSQSDDAVFPMDTAAAGSTNLVQNSAYESIPSIRPRSDSDMARSLQAEWDAEANGVAIDPTSTAAVLPSPAATPQNLVVSSPMAATSAVQSHAPSRPHRADSVADEASVGSVMYHFNGLETASRTVRLKQFTIFLRSSVDQIGHSIAMRDSSNDAAYICPLLEVLRTRFPGCRTDLGPTDVSID